MRRSSTLEKLSIESVPVAAREAMVTVVARRDEAGAPFAAVMATVQRPRRAEHENLWAHFFVDGVFIDVGRVLEIDQGGSDSLFVAKFRLPDVCLDGELHTAKVRFVTAVSRIVPRGTGENATKQGVTAVPTAEAVCELRATREDRLPFSQRLRDAR
jgi:hypothetical protein